MRHRVRRKPFPTLAGDYVGSEIEGEDLLGTLCSGKVLQGFQRHFQFLIQRDGPASQVIMVTHNANIVVNTDADQIIPTFPR